MSQEKLNELSILSIEKKMLGDLINNYASQKVRIMVCK
jgi:hypothetical protein